jgi:hypothetical protein
LPRIPIDLKQLEVVLVFSVLLCRIQTISLDMLRPSMPVLPPLPTDLDINYLDTLLLMSMHPHHQKYGDLNHDLVLDLDQSILQLLFPVVIPPEKVQI